MSLFRSRMLVIPAACAFALVACNADRPASFAPSSSAAGAAAPAFANGVRNVAGQYAGTLDDSSLGQGHARASIAQFGGSAGGPIVATFASAKRANATAGTLDGDGALRGTMVANVGSVACTFRFSARYDGSTHVLNGSYRAIDECSGDSGTFALKERCYYVLHAEIRRDVGGLKPC